MGRRSGPPEPAKACVRHRGLPVAGRRKSRPRRTSAEPLAGARWVAVPTPLGARTTGGAFAGPAHWIAADEKYLYWAHDRVAEYDDEDVRISAAHVLRRPHAGGAIETLFQFERDDRYCTPQNLRLMDGAPAWFCQGEHLESNERADTPRYMHRLAGTLREVPTPVAHHARVTASGAHVYLVEARMGGDSPIHWLDAHTGARRTIATLPYAALPRRLDGVMGGRLVGEGSDAEGTFVWALPTRGGAPSVLWRAPERIVSIAVSERRVFVATGVYPVSAITVLGDGPPRQLLRADHPIRDLMLRGEHLYFTTGGDVRRLEVGSGRVEVVARPDPAEGSLSGPMAIGGGYLYWLQRHPRDHSGPQVHRRALP